MTHRNSGEFFIFVSKLIIKDLHVNVDDINDYDEEKFAEFDYGEYDDYRFISGYCKMLKDKSILIAFGKTAKEDIQNYKI